MLWEVKSRGFRKKTTADYADIADQGNKNRIGIFIRVIRG